MQSQRHISARNVMQQHVTDFCDGGETSCVPTMTEVSGVEMTNEENLKKSKNKIVPTFTGWQTGFPVDRPSVQGSQTTQALGGPEEFK